MGRPSKLSAAQWLECERRHVVDGVPILTLAKEFGVNESALRRKIKPTIKERANGVTSLRSLAAKKIKALQHVAGVDNEIAELPVTKQIIVGDLVQQMQNISGHLAGAAEYGASTAHRLAGIANGMVMKIDPNQPLEKSLSKLQQVDALTKLSTSAGAMGMALIAGNRGAAPPPPASSTADLSDEDLAIELGRYGIESP